ncbi:ammonium transporter [Photobacterium chitinilyticum]|uniref:ammonium transporter n=1 Tax=Photobacterium chitinilyticum TaxID=2485123 RepID=UPI0018F00317|nr:ammonium transporter [Photobacterium chitinilyticum]
MLQTRLINKDVETFVENINSAVEILIQSSNTLFILLGAIMVLAMHAGFAFLEVGTVRQKNQVNALVKIIADFGFSAIAYFFIGYWVAYDITFLSSAEQLSANSGYELVKFFFLMTFAAAIPAIISGGIAERARFYPMLVGSFFTVGLVYPFFEGLIWNSNYGFQDWLAETFGAPFHDFAGSVVVHSVGGWIALVVVAMLGIRNGRYRGGRLIAFAPSNIPLLALGAWILTVGWFGFNVMSAQTMGGISGLVAVNSLMAMVGGIITALFVGKNDPGFIHNGPLAGLVAVCAGSDLMHPVGALVTGAVAGALFVWLFTYIQNKLMLDDVLGVWPLHGVCGAWGGIAAGIFGSEAFGGLGGISLASQFIGTIAGIVVAVVGSAIVYGIIKKTVGLRLTDEEEYNGADLSIHKIGAINED